jgi:uncharacterized phage protein gp47/JayE
MAFERTFDEILNGILVDFRNIFPGVDVSQGSLAYMKAAGYSSALWGLYKYQEWISRQAFPDTAETEALEHHAWVRGIARTAGESDAVYLARLLDYIRRPPAGGNKYDYEKWAKEVDDVAGAYAIPLAQGGESVDVVIVANKTTTGSEIPNQTLIDAVAAYIEDVRPVGARFVRVLAPTIISQAVTMTGVGGTISAAVAADIEAYLSGFEPGQELYLPQLLSIATDNGAANPAVTVPAATVTPSSSQMLRPGATNVS